MGKASGNGNGNGAESQVLHALESQSHAGDVILQGVRFTDPKNGDVEADFLLLIPGFGVAVLEVKGGSVSYQDGQWLLTGIDKPGYERRIHPVDQARKAKHALRRYLDRQPEWSIGLIRSAWFVVMPNTEIHGDFGPEGLTDQLVGSGQIEQLRERLVRVLDRGLLAEPRPDPDQVEDAVSLLFRSSDITIKNMYRPSGKLRGGRLSTGAKRGVMVGVGAALAAGLAIGGYAWSQHDASVGADCSSNYEPCVPVDTDVNCSDLGFQVQVIGEDIYGLDRNGDGLGCESYGPQPASSE